MVIANRDFVLHGREGHCVACERPISEHFDKNNRFAGCGAAHVAPDTRFLLVPDRRATAPTALVALKERRRTTIPRDQRNDKAAELVRSVKGRTATPIPIKPAVKAATKAASQVAQTARVRYQARVGIRDPKVAKIGSERDVEVFKTIARVKRGMSRKDLLVALDATKRTGIVDGAVRRLRLRKLLTVVSES